MPFQCLGSIGCCWGHNELSSEIPSSSFSMTEAELRTKMHDFVDHELDLSTLAKDLIARPTDNIELPTCIELLKREMHGIVRDMDINIEMEKTGDRMSAEMEEPEIMQIKAEIGCTSATCSTLPRNLQQHLINEAINCITEANMTVVKALCKEPMFKLEDLSEDLKIHETREPRRAEFLESAALQSPQLLRLIDIKATCLEGQVVLIDYWEDTYVQQVGYSAISHTYGMEVYEVFNCQCASKCFTKAHSRCSNKPCPHGYNKLSDDKHNRIVHDILRMCAILMAAGVLYTWHDGVCIAQHDEAEVMATIECMGWIYANAREAIVFLHYVGKPMTAIGLGDDQSELTCRWHTRVWTLQEAALSKCRRYCVPVSTDSFGGCQSLEEFEKRIALLYKSPSKVQVVEENKFSEMIQEMWIVFHPLFQDYKMTLLRDIVGVDRSSWFSLKVRIDLLYKAREWHYCIHSLIEQLIFTCFHFPIPHMAFIMASRRESKHVGDYVNSILALAGVKGFVAPKDIDMETSTLEFFKRQGQQGLERAVFCTNVLLQSIDEEYFLEVRKYTWLPFLWRPLAFLTKPYSCLEYLVLDDGRMELTGDIVCIEVRFTVKLEENMEYSENPSDTERREVLNMVKVIRNHDILAMDLRSCHFEYNLIITFPEAPTCSMGTAKFPRFSNFTSLTVGHGCKIKSGESFSAFVVLPQYIKHSSPDRWPALIVQGCLQTHVCKIACFETTELFGECVDEILDVNGPSTRILHKLIII